MTKKEIENFFNQYKKSIVTISKTEQQLLKESYSYDKWYALLQRKSEAIRTIFAKNLVSYKQVVLDLEENPGQLDQELAEMFLTHVDFFLSEGYRDYGVSMTILKVIRPFFKVEEQEKQSMDCAYFMGVSCLNERSLGKAVVCFSDAIACYDRISNKEELESYRIFRVMCAAYFRLLALHCMGEFPAEIMRHYYDEADRLWRRELQEGILSPKKQAAFFSLIRTLTLISFDRLWDGDYFKADSVDQIMIHFKQGNAKVPQINGGKAVENEYLDWFAQLLEEEFAYQESLPEESRCDLAARVMKEKFCYRKGQISLEDLKKNLRNMAKREASRFQVRFTYGQWDFLSLFDDELSDELFSQYKLFYMNPSYQYMHVLLRELMGHVDSGEEQAQIYQEAYRYFLQLPYIAVDGFVDTMLVDMLCHVIHFGRDRQQLVACIQNLFVHRQIMTAIHSEMVARLTVMVTDALVDQKPELFVGSFDCHSVEEVREGRNGLLQFAQDAGKCHDTGKLLCSHLINLQSRKLREDEFEVLHRHPGWGYAILSRSNELSAFAEIALYHHKAFDDAAGYPLLEKGKNSALKLFVDIITVCDTVDAATDTLGRNYAKEKNFDQVFKELMEEKGTRYSDQVVGFLEENESLRNKMRNLVDLDRGKVQHEVYRNYVYPDTQFLPSDEKYIRRMVETDLEPLCQAMGYSIKEEKDLLHRCHNYAYLIQDGNGRIYGNLLGEEQTNRQVQILQVQVEEKSRRQGLGSLLLEEFENQAQLEHMHKLYMSEVREGHFDKFGWNNGFVTSQREGFLEKIIL